MPKLLIHIFLLLILSACAGTEVNTEQAIEIENEVPDEFHLVDRVTGDTLQTDSLYSPIGEGILVPLGTSYYKGGGFTSSITKFDSNKSDLVVGHTKRFKADSLTPYLAGERTELIPPKEFKIEPNINVVKEPSQERMLPWINKDAAQYDISTLTSDQGLVSNNVNCIFKDSRRLMWFGTDKGLLSFDGTFTKNYNLESGIQDEDIKTITEDLDGNLWIGTATNSFIKFDGINFYQYLTDSLRPNYPVTNLYVDEKNEIWGTAMFGGVFHFDHETLFSYKEDQGMLSGRPTTSITFNDDGTKWITGFGVGLYKLNENGLGTTRQNSTYINNGFNDSKGRFWLAQWGSVISYIKNDSLHAFSLDPKYDTGLILSIQEDSKGRLWVLSYAEGVFMIEGDVVTHYGTKEGLGYQYQESMFIDDNDVVWLGSSGGGVSRIDPSSFSVLNTYSGFETDQIYSAVEKDDGTICYSTAEGVYMLKDSLLVRPDRFVASKSTTHTFNKAISDILVDQDRLWATGMNQGVIKYEGDNVSVFGSSMSGGVTNPTSLALDSKGQVWSGSQNEGLLRFRNDSLWAYREESSLAFIGINELLIDAADNLWVGSPTQGLAKIGSEGTTYYSTTEGLLSNEINYLFEDSDHRIWIGGPNGLNYMENGEIKKVDSPYDIFTNSIMAIFEDESGRYWITSEAGMLVLIPKENETEGDWLIDNYRVEVLDKKNGLINQTFLPNSLFQNEQGEVSAGTKSGLLTWPENTAVLEESVAPHVSIQLVSVKGQSIDASLSPNDDISFDANSFEGFNKSPKNLVLAHDFNSISIDFNAIYWKDPSRLSFTYFLEGYDEDWSMGGSENRAVYKNLDYGKYTFHLKSEIQNGVSSEELIYEFEVLRPWWHTWIARIFFLGVFVLLIFLFIKARTRKLQKRQIELEQEIKNATSEIRQQKDEIEEAHTEIKDSIAYAKRIQSAILPPLKLVKEYIPNSFILYKPKDVVAGDFYWMEPVANKTLFAAADCTGHGVPGAMVSVICHNALNRTVRELKLTDPGEILDKAREMIIAEFDKSDEDVRDGMDIAICSLEGNTLKYAGANNPLWIIRKGATEIKEIKANKEPIGKYEKLTSFTTHTIQLNEGDSFYIFSDGFSDQFGGEKGKKFKGAQFKKLLLSLQDKPIDAQLKVIDDTFEDWRGDIEQVDDVCIIGVRV